LVFPQKTSASRVDRVVAGILLSQQQLHTNKPVISLTSTIMDTSVVRIFKISNQIK